MNHQKKFLTLSFLMLCLSFKIFATGAGFQFTASPAFFVTNNSFNYENFSGRVAGTIKSGRLPMTVGFGLETDLSQTNISYGFFGFLDYNLTNIQIYNTWNFFSGIGVQASILTTTNFTNWDAIAGLRFFLGTNLLFYDNFLEVYLQQNIVPGYFKNLNNITSKGTFIVSFPLDAGLRMHF